MTFWGRLREGREVFEEWIEEDMDQFMRQLVKSALVEQRNPALENLLLPATSKLIDLISPIRDSPPNPAQGPQGLYRAVVDALGDPEVLSDRQMKKQLLSSVMSILKKSLSTNIALVPSARVFPALQDLYSSDNQDDQVIANAFINEFTDGKWVRQMYHRKTAHGGRR